MAMKVANGLDLQNQKIVSLADPSSNTDAVTKQYVDGLLNGLRWKAPVRAATTTNGTLASAFANGSTIDGVSLATNDRILLKNQTTQTENGIYTVNASGAPTRAVDADSTSELMGAAVLVTTGTVNADTAYVQVTDNPTIGSSNIVWNQFGGGQAYSAGAGLTLTSTTFDVVGDASINVQADSIGLASGVAGAGLTLTSGVLDVVGDASITVSANSLGLASGVAGAGLTLTSGVLDVVGGTGITVSANSLAVSSVVVRQYAAAIGDGSTVNIVVTHNLGTQDVQVTVRNASSPYEQIFVDNEATTTNTVTLRFATAPTSNQYRCIVQGAS